MGLRPAAALLLVVTLGAAALAWLLSLSARLPPVFAPPIYAHSMPQHAYRAGGVNLLAPVALGIVIFTLCADLYFWLTAFPRNLRYRPKSR